MANINIRQANLSDLNSLMLFIDNYWKKDHILAVNKDFFLYEFQRGDKLNIIIAEAGDQILGFLGYFYYNSNLLPDMAGSIWKIHPDSKDRLLGLKVRDYFVKNIKQNFFSTPGPGPHMQPVYRMLRMSWNKMEHFYMTNTEILDFKILHNPEVKKINKVYSRNIEIRKISSIDEIKNYIFNENIVPLKDKKYIKKRYLEHPIYQYDVYILKYEGSIKNIFIAREVLAKNRSAYRLVDFIGDVDFIREISSFLNDFIHENRMEFIDFINYGYNPKVLIEAGFVRLDLDCENTIVPNYFEPFVQKNVPVYCVADKTSKVYRQHKADGDMDRPSIGQEKV